MKWKWIPMTILLLIIITGLFGCSNKTSNVADGAAEIAYTYQDSKTNNLETLHTTDKKVIRDIFAFLDKRKLLQESNQSNYSQATVQIFNVDGTNKVVKLNDTDIKLFSKKFAYKMQPTIYVIGNVVEVKKDLNSKDVSVFTIKVLPSYQKEVGEITEVAIQNARIFNNGKISNLPTVGDKIELFITDRFLETSPTQTKAIKVDILSIRNTNELTAPLLNQENPVYANLKLTPCAN